MTMMPGAWEWLVILGVLVLLFGAKKLPSLGGAIGESIKNFKKGIKDIDGGDDQDSVEGNDSESKKISEKKDV